MLGRVKVRSKRGLCEIKPAVEYARAALLTLGLVIASNASMGESSSGPGLAPDCTNPILPGYFADPSMVQYEGKAYLYATLDPWGGETLGCWESSDLSNWTYRELNWPTKVECTSLTSKDAMVWAPSVVQGTDGRFYMYVSVGSEVWAGSADHPLGPWRNLLGDQPLIPEDFKPGYHMIDAEAFVDDDGQVYLYWGSGWNWVNGKCWVGKLDPDMVTLDGEVLDVTPSNFFEAPFMVKRHGRYFLMYSNGKTTTDTYQVHYAVGDSPLGPFEEAGNSPILVTDRKSNILSPGHHAVFRHEGEDYILYHRHSIPFDPEAIGRQVCLGPIQFLADGTISKIQPSHQAPVWAQGRVEGDQRLAVNAVATSSGNQEGARAAYAFDNNYATRWVASGRDAWLQVDLGEEREIGKQVIRLEYPWKHYRFTVEASEQGEEWEVVADFTKTPATGSPVLIEHRVRSRFFRLVFFDDTADPVPAVFEWNLLER